MAALTAMNADTDCVDAIQNNNRMVLCSGSCGTLITGSLNTCPNVSHSNEYTAMHTCICM